MTQSLRLSELSLPWFTGMTEISPNISRELIFYSPEILLRMSFIGKIM